MPFSQTLIKNSILTQKTSSTFVDNLSLPIHRWYRYSAGFSASWTRELIEQEKNKGRKTVFDPFAGSGTVALEGELCGVKTIGIESHPFVARIASAKLCWREDPQEFQRFAFEIMTKAQKTRISTKSYPELIQKCFYPEVLMQLNSLKQAWESKKDDSPKSELVWLALVSIIRECSHVGTAPWQYVLPNKSKAKKSFDAFDAFHSKIQLMANDMIERQKLVDGPKAKIIWDDARECRSISNKWADLVITSPPYANNYDYADATRLEMSFFGDINGWGDLQEKIRKYLIRSCTQHVARLNGETYHMLDDDLLRPIKNEIVQTCEKLEKEREGHGGKKPYHTMIASYFFDMARVWKSLRRVTNKNSLVCFVIGDSAPYGIHVPVEKWFGEIALSVGFKSYVFEKTRDRNIKWKNRKHRVPLHEGRLWVQG